MRTIASHGGLTKYVHDVIGCNSRLDALQAVVLRAKLARLAGWNAARRAAAARYDELLAPVDVVRPVTLPGQRARVAPVRGAGAGGDRRDDRSSAALNAAGVGAAIHYPVPVHLTPAFAGLGHRPGAFPHAEAAAGEILSLPIYPQITAEQQQRWSTHSLRPCGRPDRCAMARPAATSSTNSANKGRPRI